MLIAPTEISSCSWISFAGTRLTLYAMWEAIERGWLWKHESGTYVKFTQAGADPFA